jgi:plastocyanin
MLSKSAVAIGALLTAISVAQASEFRIAQKNQEFSQKEISIKVGDTIVFANEDNVAHNVFSASENFEFDSMMQDVGKSSSVRFTKVGVFDIRCAIHPKMKLKVTVTK